MKPYFEEDGITIYHADCRELFHELRADLLLTDPPYGINADRDRNSQVNGWVDYGSSGWDKAKAPQELLNLAISRTKAAVIWGGNYFSLPTSMGWFCWDKGQRDFSLADGELAWTSENRAMRIMTLARSVALQDGRQHPTQKPLALMKWCLSFFPESKSVLDPFMGSGTTLVAAKDIGIKAIGIDAEEKYCEIAAKRLAQSVLQFV